MSREEIIQYVANWFGIEPNDDGVYDLDDSDWTTGCRDYVTGKWFCLKEVVKCIDGMVSEYGLKEGVE